MSEKGHSQVLELLATFYVSVTDLATAFLCACRRHVECGREFKHCARHNGELPEARSRAVIAVTDAFEKVPLGAGWRKDGRGPKWKQEDQREADCCSPSRSTCGRDEIDNSRNGERRTGWKYNSKVELTTFSDVLEH